MEKSQENPLHINTPKQIYIGDGHSDCELSKAPPSAPSSMDEAVGTCCGCFICLTCFHNLCVALFN